MQLNFTHKTYSQLTKLQNCLKMHGHMISMEVLLFAWREISEELWAMTWRNITPEEAEEHWEYLIHHLSQEF